MRTEDDLRAAFVALERDAPDVDSVLAAVPVGAPAGPRRDSLAAPRWRKGPLIAGGLLTTGALTVAAAVLVATAIQSTSRAKTGQAGTGAAAAGHRPEATLSARQILLATAASTEKSAATGRYWHTSEIDGETADNDPHHPTYEIASKSQVDAWVARSPSQRTWTIRRPLSVWPATPADQAAWRRDGSPASVHISGKPVGNADLITMGAGPAVATWQPGTAQAFTAQMTRSQLDQLPTDPGRLASVLRQRIGSQIPNLPFIAAHKQSIIDAMLFNDGTGLLADPISPQVRAADYRMLAAMPGMRAMGQVRDVLGRTGYGVAMIGPGSFNGYSVLRFTEEDLLVVNTRTGALLASEQIVRGPASGATAQSILPWQPGEPFSYQAFLGEGWTSQLPHLPATQRGPGSGAG
jgi:hypothetical protein